MRVWLPRCVCKFLWRRRIFFYTFVYLERRLIWGQMNKCDEQDTDADVVIILYPRPRTCVSWKFAYEEDIEAEPFFSVLKIFKYGCTIEGSMKQSYWCMVFYTILTIVPWQVALIVFICTCLCVPCTNYNHYQTSMGWFEPISEELFRQLN